MFIIRLDDACEFMDVTKWNRMEEILDQYSVKPLVGIIPSCEDTKMKGVYAKDELFWKRVDRWKRKKWTIALHGFEHLYISNHGGINPLHNRSEFAGVPLEAQKEKIKKGLNILSAHDISPTVFFPPGHTFDENTLKALAEESDIKVVSDTISSSVYYYKGFWFVPQQSGRCRKIPVRIATYCFHPNTMQEKNFAELESFLNKNKKLLTDFSNIDFSNKRKMGIYDRLLKRAYFLLRRMRGMH